MTVSERRYLKKIPLCSAVVKCLGFAPQAPLKICTWPVKAQTFDHLHLIIIDIALKKLPLP